MKSSKVQALFWLFAISIMLYIWIIWIVVQTFVLAPPSIGLPEQDIILLFILWAMLAICVVAGTIISIFISNKRYMNRFGAFFVIILVSFLAGKSMFG